MALFSVQCVQSGKQQKIDKHDLFERCRFSSTNGTNTYIRELSHTVKLSKIHQQKQTAVQSNLK